jgi:pimeloyl-ACP methyl ester carboxylesterase
MVRSGSVVRGLAAALLGLGLAACAANNDPERFPTSQDFPPEVMRRVDFTAATPERWRLSSLRTPERPQAPWRIVVVTGTPSWSEYWAPTIAKAPEGREMIVVDRPGFAASEPEEAVADIAKQAEALAPLLDGPAGQRIVLVGQSFGSAIAALMAAHRPDRVRALVLVSSFFGDRGPTARRLLFVGRTLRPILPRDLRNSVSEVSAQGPQLPRAWAALRSLDIPVVFLHGDRDTFVPVDAARRIADEYGHTLITVPGGDHFLNACCVDAALAAVERAISEAEVRGAAVASTATTLP